MEFFKFMIWTQDIVGNPYMIKVILAKP